MAVCRLCCSTYFWCFVYLGFSCSIIRAGLIGLQEFVPAAHDFGRSFIKMYLHKALCSFRQRHMNQRLFPCQEGAFYKISFLFQFPLHFFLLSLCLLPSCTVFVAVVLFLLKSSKLSSVLKNDESHGNSSPAVKINPGPGQPAEKTDFSSCGFACLWQHFPEFPRAFKLLLQGPCCQVLSVC